jgi:hypothetical protein
MIFPLSTAALRALLEPRRRRWDARYLLDAAMFSRKVSNTQQNSDTLTAQAPNFIYDLRNVAQYEKEIRVFAAAPTATPGLRRRRRGCIAPPKQQHIPRNLLNPRKFQDIYSRNFNA